MLLLEVLNVCESDVCQRGYMKHTGFMACGGWWGGVC